MRDESTHMNFGIDVITTIKHEQPEVFPKGIFGLNAEGFKQYIEHIADRRLVRVGIDPVYGSTNPFPWMSEAVDLNKEKNFFETRVTEYKTGGTLAW